ncbi:translation factor GTPase family protein [Lachnospiraceae bacterium 62-35]
MKRLVIGILAHVDAGKTTLSEGILYLTGSIRKLGRVDNRDAFLDTYELERARGITIFSKQAVFSLGDTSVTLLDTPGHVDFSPEMERTLQILDYAILVVSGADGVQGHTETLWQLLTRYKIPVFLFINKMDQSGTEKESLMKSLKKRLDGSCVDFSSEGDEFLEDLAVCDERILEEYLETNTVKQGEIRQLIRERRVFPCYFGSALKLTGVEEFLDGLKSYMLCPAYGAEFGAKVFKISRDESGNRLTHMKITGGALKVRALLPGREEEKINQIRIYSGARYEAAGEAEAGMVCAVTGPLTTYPGQGIGVEVESELPILEPVLTYKVMPPPGTDLSVLLKTLRCLEEEEPQLHVVWNEALEEMQVQVMGDVQIEVLKSLLEERFSIKVEFNAGNIVYKETILNSVEGVGHFEPLRHYAEVHLLMEPLEQGSGLQFETQCSEDILDKNWQRLVLTHLEERRHPGVLTGSEITDMRITLVSGRAHLKHTEGGDFRQATYRAVRQGLMEARCRLLEPYYEFRLETPEESVGRAMADLERMYGIFLPPIIEDGMAILTGKAPAACMRDYQRDVIAYTRGRGRLICRLKSYEPCHNEEEVIESRAYEPELDFDNPTGSVFCSHGSGYLVPWYEVKNHMHISGLSAMEDKKKISEPDEDEYIIPYGSDPGIRPKREETEREERMAPPSHSSFTGSGIDDKELEAIFKRTYGESKRHIAYQNGPKTLSYGQQKKSEEKPEEVKEYLLVDGYNIIFAWEELRELAKATIDGARHKLMDILCNYQGYKKCTLIVVFDAYKVTGSMGQAIDYHNIHVVYTKEAETADQYIEKLAHEMGRKYHVRVATSDGLEQLIIRGQGCMLLSAADLKEEIEQVSKKIQEEQRQLPKPGRNYLLEYADEEVTEAFLEKNAKMIKNHRTEK